MYEALSNALEQAEADDGVRVILLHGKGDAFTAGNDLEDFLKKPWKGQAIPPAVRFIHAVARARKPLVAAVQGLAVGVGTTILLHCDLVYAADDCEAHDALHQSRHCAGSGFDRAVAAGYRTSAGGGVVYAGRCSERATCLRNGDW